MVSEQFGWRGEQEVKRDTSLDLWEVETNAARNAVMYNWRHIWGTFDESYPDAVHIWIIRNDDSYSG